MASLESESLSPLPPPLPPLLEEDRPGTAPIDLSSMYIAISYSRNMDTKWEFGIYMPRGKGWGCYWSIRTHDARDGQGPEWRKTSTFTEGSQLLKGCHIVSLFRIHHAGKPGHDKNHTIAVISHKGLGTEGSGRLVQSSYSSEIYVLSLLIDICSKCNFEFRYGPRTLIELAIESTEDDTDRRKREWDRHRLPEILVDNRNLFWP
ncbi:MAG: hypothetical protein M1834_000408 [Cirrosporium novae-zelandiae]|nr:MAG: hypothetical protein M1834_000408 [Cirrosporium novae-zelandiae]